MTFKHLIQFSLCSVLIISCGKSDPEPINVNTVDQDFELFTKQQIDQNGTKFILTIKSQEPELCENAILEASYSLIAKNITIVIQGNIVNGDCIEGEIYTETSFELPSDIGLYNVEIIKGELLSTSGSLNITESELNFNVDNLGGIFFEGQNIKRIPEFLVWGYYADAEPNSQTQIFLEEMVTEVGFKQTPFENLEEGDYSLFSVDSDSKIVIEDVKLDHITVAYFIEEEIFWDKLKDRLIEHNASFPRLKYFFQRWDGELVENL